MIVGYQFTADPVASWLVPVYDLFLDARPHP
jgi:hypothetical protein